MPGSSRHSDDPGTSTTRPASPAALTVSALARSTRPLTACARRSSHDVAVPTADQTSITTMTEGSEAPRPRCRTVGT
jgi:DNA-binding helix-hairpin-helix protein with protein kinase domain